MTLRANCRESVLLESGDKQRSHRAPSIYLAVYVRTQQHDRTSTAAVFGNAGFRDTVSGTSLISFKILLSAIVTATSNAFCVLVTAARFFPAISNAVPCAGVATGIGRPPCTVTPPSNESSFMAICPWSWYIVTIPSKCSRFRKMVSQGNGPCTSIPR